MNLNEIRHKLNILKERDKDLVIPGAEFHRYLLNEKAHVEEIDAFEKNYSIKLPEEFKKFLLDIGNGGAGPLMGVVGVDDLYEEFIDSVSSPFPYTSKFNAPSSLLDEMKNAELSDDDSRYSILVEKYWDVCSRNGSIVLTEFGDIRFLLIVTGEEAGNVWLDKTQNFEGFSPIFLSNEKGKWYSEIEIGKRAKFADWYMSWLDWALDELNH